MIALLPLTPTLSPQAGRGSLLKDAQQQNPRLRGRAQGEGLRHE